MPPEPTTRSVDRDSEDPPLADVRRVPLDVPTPAAPRGNDLFGQFLDCRLVTQLRPEVPRAAVFRGFRRAEVGPESEVPVQRLEDVLPRSDRVRPTKRDGPRGLKRTEDISHDPVRCPVATRNDIARASGRYADPVPIEIGGSKE